jgi:hypothetical protein
MAFNESTKSFKELIVQKETTIEEQNMKMAYMTAEFENMLAVRIN